MDLTSASIVVGPYCTSRIVAELLSLWKKLTYVLGKIDGHNYSVPPCYDRNINKKVILKFLSKAKTLVVNNLPKLASSNLT